MLCFKLRSACYVMLLLLFFLCAKYKIIVWKADTPLQCNNIANAIVAEKMFMCTFSYLQTVKCKLLSKIELKRSLGKPVEYMLEFNCAPDKLTGQTTLFNSLLKFLQLSHLLD